MKDVSHGKVFKLIIIMFIYKKDIGDDKIMSCEIDRKKLLKEITEKIDSLSIGRKTDFYEFIGDLIVESAAGNFKRSLDESEIELDDFDTDFKNGKILDVRMRYPGTVKIKSIDLSDQLLTEILEYLDDILENINS